MQSSTALFGIAVQYVQATQDALHPKEGQTWVEWYSGQWNRTWAGHISGSSTPHQMDLWNSSIVAYFDRMRSHANMTAIIPWNTEVGLAFSHDSSKLVWRKDRWIEAPSGMACENERHRWYGRSISLCDEPECVARQVHEE